jgi:plasmid stabilization system protein ParE
MAREVILTPLAEINYEGIIEYLIENWEPRVASNFIDRFENVCGLLVENSEIFPFYDKKSKYKNAFLQNTTQSILRALQML